MVPLHEVADRIFSSPPPMWFVALLAVNVVWLAWTVRVAYLTRLRSVPGPFLAKFTRLWIVSKVAQGQSHHFYRKLHAKYGPVVRIAPDKVILADVVAASSLYSVGTQFYKSDYYKAFGIEMAQSPLPDMPNPTILNLFSTRDLDYHRRVKSAIAPAYAIASLKQMEPFVDTCAELFVEQMRKRSGEVIDIGSWLQYYAFDVIGMITFSKPFDYLDSGTDALALIEPLHGGIIYASIVGQIPWLHRFLLGNTYLQTFLTRYTPMGKASPLVPIRKKKAMNERLNEQQVVDTLFMNVLAGSDTTAITLRAVLYMLIKHPEAYKKLQAEIDEYEAAGKFAKSAVPFDVGKQMPYLKAAIKESMRIHPGVPMPLERLVPAGGMEVLGYHLPTRTAVGVAPSVINYNKEIFGGDAASFRPDRWVHCSPQQLSAMDRYFFSFGAGPRLCIGKNIALLEMTKLVPQLLRHFDIEWASDHPEWQISGYWFAKPKDMFVKMIPRNK
ncbi:cytochrome P450 [Myriangium duriaei CBS 260.36]|uniref:Cytochrome P450 n=1 Tax=Myriangium duriaei CBS 260.36 TaxID=1168546 RepID=A0A9P4J2D6_9PEZI|nr:cytochrome P450 [Myriangium duriaei CBS 260.36]